MKREGDYWTSFIPRDIVVILLYLDSHMLSTRIKGTVRSLSQMCKPHLYIEDKVEYVLHYNMESPVAYNV